MPVTIRNTSKKPIAPLSVDEWPDPPSRRQEQPLPMDRRTNIDPRIKIECVEIIDVGEIVPNERNARKHSDHQISLIAANIDEFGFLVPLVLDERNRILSGYGRFLAAKRLGLAHLPIVRAKHLTAAQKRAFTIADNRLAALSEWDMQILGEELSFFFSNNEEVKIDPLILGFDTPEADHIILGESEVGEKPDPADQSIPEPETDAVTTAGDVWLCDDHIVTCGDATLEGTFTTAIGSDYANMVFTDPPYNVPNSGHVSGRDGVREFAMARGEMTREQFRAFLSTVLGHVRARLADGAVVYTCMDWRHIFDLHAAAQPLFGEPKNLIVWDKKNAGMGSFYRSQHELICVYATPGKITNNFGLGGKGRYRTNVWKYPGLNSFGRGRDEALAMHPTVKPVAMVVDALLDCSKRGDIVLDAFGGSGTTMIAAERTGRRARLIEIDPLYCDVIVKRWQDFAGGTATLAQTGETFAKVKARRGAGRNVEGDHHEQEDHQRR